MTGNLLAKRLKQAYEERYCNGTYSLELEVALDDVTCYVFTYTYNDGYRVCLEITISSLGEVKFYSPVHCYYISSFGKSFKSAINVVRMLFDLIECNREAMLRYYGEEPEQPTEEVAEQEQPTYIDTDGVKTTWEEASKRLSANYGEDYCIGNFYPDIPNVNPYLVRALHYRKDCYTYRRYYSNPNCYGRPQWAQKPKPSKEMMTIYNAFRIMMRCAFTDKESVKSFKFVHDYMTKLYMRDKINTAEYKFYTNKIVDALKTVTGKRGK